MDTTDPHLRWAVPQARVAAIYLEHGRARSVRYGTIAKTLARDVVVQFAVDTDTDRWSKNSITGDRYRRSSTGYSGMSAVLAPADGDDVAAALRTIRASNAARAVQVASEAFASAKRPAEQLAALEALLTAAQGAREPLTRAAGGPGQ